MSDNIEFEIYRRLKYAMARNTRARLEPDMVQHIMANLDNFLDKKEVEKKQKEYERELERRRKKKLKQVMARYKEAKKQIKLPAHQRITAKKSREMAEDRKRGMTYLEIAIKHSVAVDTAARHSNPKIKEKQDENYRRRYERRRNDPVQYAKQLEYVRRYKEREREREKNAKAKNTDV